VDSKWIQSNQGVVSPPLLSYTPSKLIRHTTRSGSMEVKGLYCFSININQRRIEGTSNTCVGEQKLP